MRCSTLKKTKKNATGLTAQLVGKALGLERLSPETRSLSAIGGLPETADQPFWRTFFRSIRDSAVILGYMLMFTVPLFLLGFVPVIGQTVIPVIAALVEGFFLTAELTTVSMERRGILRKERFALLRGRMPAALGFGVPVFLASMLPLVNVILMPAIVAGATMLVRLHLAREPRSAGAIAA